ncbi:MAG: hypothetical protein U0793_07150 [Gemmataceae bacterium]
MAKKKKAIFRSRIRWLACILALLAIGGGIALLVVSGNTAPDRHPEIPQWIGIGILGVIALPCFLMVAVRFIWRPTLILSDDRLQLIHFGSTVAGQIPLENLSALRIGFDVAEEESPLVVFLRFLSGAIGSGAESEEPERAARAFIEVSLVTRKDKKTWWPRMLRKGARYDIRIPNIYDQPPGVIIRVIESRQQRFWKEKADEAVG